MSTRTLAVMISLLALGACGPEAHQLPPSGRYQVEAITVENGCDPWLDDDLSGEVEVKVADDEIQAWHSDHLGVPFEDCDGCGPLTVASGPLARLDAETGLYTSQQDWRPSGECRTRQNREIEVLDARTLQARITDEWAADDGSDCPWEFATPEGCTVVREYTYTLIEACDDCDLTPSTDP